MLQTLVLALQQEAKDAGHAHPLFIGIDQENGLVTRIMPPIVPRQPGSMTLGATGSGEDAYRVGKATGEMLDFFGINMNYAPDCDVNSEPSNPVIGVRSPGDNPEFVARITSEIAGGLREKRVVPCVKHFPGHGDTNVDSHYGLPVIEKTRDELERCELIPFRRAVAEGIESVMTAHIALPKISTAGLPATLSADALNMLRVDMKYDGVIITDCLEMDGVRSTYGTVEGALMSLKAGSDSILICHTYQTQVDAIERVCRAVQAGDIAQERIDEALRRVTSLKERFLTWERALTKKPLDELDEMNDRHAEIARDVFARSVTVVRDESGLLPVSSASKIAFLSPVGNVPTGGGAVDDSGSISSTFADIILHRYGTNVSGIQFSDATLSEDQWKTVDDCGVVILATKNAREGSEQYKLGLQLAARCGSKLIAIATCNPYDFLDNKDVRTYLAIYEPSTEAFSAALDIIFGQKTASGQLPVGANSPFGRSGSSNITIKPYDAARDFEGVQNVWKAALPTYPILADRLDIYLSHPRSHHLVARQDDTVVGFCVAYDDINQGKVLCHISTIAVHPSFQNRGIGTRLITEARSSFRQNQHVEKTDLVSYFPRIWPGIPTDLPLATQEWFIHRGFRVSPLDQTSADLYQDIRDFQPSRKYLDRAEAAGFTFRPIEPQDYEKCLIGQRKNFSSYTVSVIAFQRQSQARRLMFAIIQGWVEAYHHLNPKDHPSSIMAAFDKDGDQVGWTLMLAPDSTFLRDNWALPPLAGPRTGLIGCVGVDEAYRTRGVGLAMLCHAIENLRMRGTEGIFIDWTTKVDWYGKLGFRVWRKYRSGEI